MRSSKENNPLLNETKLSNETKKEESKKRPRIKDNMEEKEYQRINKKLGKKYFYSNGTPLSDDQINSLNKWSADEDEKNDAMYSKEYLQGKGVKIDRGGILRLWNEKEKKPELFVTIQKSPQEKAKLPQEEKAMLVGKGGYGKVKLIQNLDTKEVHILKTLTKPSGEYLFKNEAMILHALGRGHKGVAEKKWGKSKKPKGQLYLIQDLVYGDELAKILKAGITISDDERFYIALQVLLAIKELHEKNILHCDIKVENVMYDLVNKTVSIIDFGSAIYTPLKSQWFNEVPDGAHGTPGCIAPEIMEEGYSEASDVYALGRFFQDMFNIKDSGGGNDFGIFKSTLSIKDEYLDEIKELANSMLEEDPNNRVSLDRAIEKLLSIEKKHRNERLENMKKGSKLSVLVTSKQPDVEADINQKNKNGQTALMFNELTMENKKLNDYAAFEKIVKQFKQQNQIKSLRREVFGATTEKNQMAVISENRKRFLAIPGVIEFLTNPSRLNDKSELELPNYDKNSNIPGIKGIKYLKIILGRIKMDELKHPGKYRELNAFNPNDNWDEELAKLIKSQQSIPVLRQLGDSKEDKDQLLNFTYKLDIRDHIKYTCKLTIDEKLEHETPNCYIHKDDVVGQDSLDQQLKKTYPDGTKYVMMFYKHEAGNTGRYHTSLLVAKIDDKKHKIDLNTVMNIDGYDLPSYVDTLEQKAIRQRLVVKDQNGNNLQDPSWNNMNCSVYSANFANVMLNIIKSNEGLLDNVLTFKKDKSELLKVIQTELASSGRYLENNNGIIVKKNDTDVHQYHTHLRLMIAKRYLQEETTKLPDKKINTDVKHDSTSQNEISQASKYKQLSEQGTKDGIRNKLYPLFGKNFFKIPKLELKYEKKSISITKKLSEIDGEWNNELGVYLPASIEKFEKFFRHPEGIKLKQKMHELLQRLLAWAKQNEIPEKICQQAENNFRKYITYGGGEGNEYGANVSYRKSLLPLYQQGVTYLNELVKIIEEKNETQKERDIKREKVQSVFEGFLACGPLVYTSIITAVLSLKTEVDIELLNWRRNVALEIILKNSPSLKIRDGNQIHFQNAVLNDFSEELGLIKIEDEHIKNFNDSEVSELSRVIKILKNELPKQLTLENLMIKVINDLDIKTLSKQFKSTDPKQFNDARNKLEELLNRYGVDDSFNMNKIISTNNEGKVLGLKAIAQQEIWHTLFNRLSSSGFVNLPNETKKTLDNEHILNLYQNKPLNMSTVTEEIVVKSKHKVRGKNGQLEEREVKTVQKEKMSALSYFTDAFWKKPLLLNELALSTEQKKELYSSILTSLQDQTISEEFSKEEFLSITKNLDHIKMTINEFFISQKDLSAFLARCTEEQIKEVWHHIQSHSEFKNLIFDAAERGNKEFIKLLVDSGVNLNQKDSQYGSTALMFAAQAGHSEVVKLLIDAKADVNQQNKLGYTALMFAAESGDKNVIKQILDAKAGINQKNKNGNSAFIVAANKGDAKACLQLLFAGADISHLLDWSENSQFGYGLLKACTTEEAKTFCRMFDKEYLGHFFMYAANKGDAKACLQLLFAGADISHLLDWSENSQFGYGLLKACTTEEAKTFCRMFDKEYLGHFFMYAANKGDAKACLQLLFAGADISHLLDWSNNSQFGYGLLKACTTEEAKTFCRMFDKEYLGHFFMYAANKGDAKACLQLLFAGADISHLLDWANNSQFGYGLLKACTTEEAKTFCRMFDKGDLGNFLIHAAQNVKDSEIRKILEQRIKELEELETIKKNGLEQRQVQLILQTLLQDNPEVYVPSISTMSGNSNLFLDTLKQQGKKYVAFSFDVNQQHQVAVWVKLGSPHEVRVIDSLDRKHNNSFETSMVSASNRLKKLLGDSEMVIKMPSSPYESQQDDWSCGIYTINHLLHELKSVQQSSNNAHQKEKTVLKPDDFLKNYYQHYKKGCASDEIIQASIEQQTQRKRSLMRQIEHERDKQGFYNSNEKNNQKDIFKSIADFLQFNVWGNLDRKSDIENQKGRITQINSYQDSLSLEQLLSEYESKKPADLIGKDLLILAIIFPDKKEQQTLISQFMIAQTNKIDVKKEKEGETTACFNLLLGKIIKTKNPALIEVIRELCQLSSASNKSELEKMESLLNYLKFEEKDKKEYMENIKNYYPKADFDLVLLKLLKECIRHSYQQFSYGEKNKNTLTDEQSYLKLGFMGREKQIKILIEKNLQNPEILKSLEESHLISKLANNPLAVTLLKEYKNILCFSAAEGDLEAVKLSLKSGVDVNSLSSSGYTPLMYAINGGYKEIVEILIQSGADLNQKNKEGKTALDYTANDEIKKLILLYEKTPVSAVELAKTLVNKSSPHIEMNLFKTGADSAKPEEKAKVEEKYKPTKK